MALLVCRRHRCCYCFHCLNRPNYLVAEMTAPVVPPAQLPVVEQLAVGFSLAGRT
jgi:hypothetical protein